MGASGFDSACGGIAVPLHFPVRLQGGRNFYSALLPKTIIRVCWLKTFDT
jgi:hypothetical protein